jgi:uncharacterized membrane protein YgdD (TMEM256/DUF423 family)
MHATNCLRLGALFAGIAVGLGAFAAHGMKGSFEASALQTFETGVRYQMYHGLALLVCAALAQHGWRVGAAAVSFVIGIALFSGSLYALVLLDVRWLGAITPFGGVAFLVGWALLLLRSGRRQPPTA